MSLDLTSGKKRLVSSSGTIFYIIDSARNEIIQALSQEDLLNSIMQYLELYYLSESTWVSNVIDNIASAFGSYYRGYSLDLNKETTTGPSSGELVITFYGYYIFNFGFDTAGVSQYEYDYNLRCVVDNGLSDSVFLYATVSEGSDIENKGGIAGELSAETSTAYLDGFTFTISLDTSYQGEPFITNVVYTTNGETAANDGVLDHAVDFFNNSSIMERITHDDALLYDALFKEGAISSYSSNTLGFWGISHYMNIPLGDGPTLPVHSDVYLTSDSYALKETGYYPTTTTGTGSVTNLALSETFSYGSNQTLYKYDLGKNNVGTSDTRLYFFSHPYVTEGNTETILVPDTITDTNYYDELQSEFNWLELTIDGVTYGNQFTIMDFYCKNNESISRDNWLVRLTQVNVWSCFRDPDASIPQDEIEQFESFVQKWGTVRGFSSTYNRYQYYLPRCTGITYVVASLNGYRSYSAGAIYSSLPGIDDDITYVARESNDWSSRPSLDGYTFIQRQRTNTTILPDESSTLRDFENNVVNGYRGVSMDSLV